MSLFKIQNRRWYNKNNLSATNTALVEMEFGDTDRASGQEGLLIEEVGTLAIVVRDTAMLLWLEMRFFSSEKKSYLALFHFIEA